MPVFHSVVALGGDAVGDETRADELRLIGAARDGDRGAFGALYTLYGRLVHGIVLARVPRTDVEDLVQDVFVQAMQRLASLRDPRAFGGWLAAIARNLATDHLRRAPRLAEMPQDLAASSNDRTQALAVLAIIRACPKRTGKRWCCAWSKA